MNNAAQRAQIKEYVRKAFLAKIMQMNDIRQNKKLELRGELGRHGHSVHSNAWTIGEIEIEEDCIANLLRQRADLYIDAYKRVGLTIGPEVLRDIAHSQVELTSSRRSSLIGEAQLRAVRTNKPRNLSGYGHLGKKASVAMMQIAANVDLYNMSHSATAADGPETMGAIGRDLKQEPLPAASLASNHSSERDGKQGQGDEFEKLGVPITSAPPSQETIWTKIWSWGAVSVLFSVILAGWMTFMTSGHSQAADGFLFAGTALFLVKFWTWEETRRQPPLRKWFLQAGVTFLSLTIAVGAFLWNHVINRSVITSQSSRPSVAGTKPSGTGTAHDEGKDAVLEPKPEEQTRKATGERAMPVARRVKIIIANQLQVKVGQLKSDEDFEADLGADPTSVYFLMESLGLEYDITIPSSDLKNLHTVGETISYIENRVGHK